MFNEVAATLNAGVIKSLFFMWVSSYLVLIWCVSADNELREAAALLCLQNERLTSLLC